MAFICLTTTIKEKKIKMLSILLNYITLHNKHSEVAKILSYIICQLHCYQNRNDSAISLSIISHITMQLTNEKNSNHINGIPDDIPDHKSTVMWQDYQLKFYKKRTINRILKQKNTIFKRFSRFYLEWDLRGSIIFHRESLVAQNILTPLELSQKHINFFPYYEK